METKRELHRQPTVILSNVLDQKHKNNDELVEFVYNASHIWSKRSTERAFEYLTDETLSYGWSPEPVKGGLRIIEHLHKIYDLIDDFHFTIQKIYRDGDLSKGTIIVHFSLSGESIKTPVQTGFPGTPPFHLNGVYIWTVVNKKITESRVYYDFGASTPYVFSLMEGRRSALMEDK